MLPYPHPAGHAKSIYDVCTSSNQDKLENILSKKKAKPILKPRMIHSGNMFGKSWHDL
jgi:hypothetical protein